jgi:hypothetical protein
MLARTDWIAGHSPNLSKHIDLVHRVRPESLVRADSLTVRVPFRRHYHCGAAASFFAARLTIFAAFRPPQLSLRSQATNQADRLRAGRGYIFIIVAKTNECECLL